jgi:uncharacterized membrane protein (DUF485 family)
MSSPDPSTIGAMPEYQELLQKRRAVAIPLTALMLVVYFTFILLVAYAPDFLHQSAFGGVTSIGIVMGLGVIFLTFIITFIYARYANTHIDPLVSQIQQKAGGK